SNSPSSPANSPPYYSFSEPSYTPISRTLSLLTPLVHHPAVRKGDSNHFVALTSTTYGSLVDPPSLKLHDAVDSEHPSSPDSVINTWELMKGLDDDLQFTFQSIENPVVSKPLWKHLSEESLPAKMDPTYRKALLQVEHEIHRQVEDHHIIESNADDNRIVLYYTSLRGIRKTYEDCCAVRSIIRGFRVCIDEKDISVDRSYKTELQEALKEQHVSLPQVFIRGKCIGGAEVIKQLNEAGELAKLLEGFPVKDIGIACCEVCGDARFVPCPNCNGSRKVYGEEDGKLRRCPDCNENGLIRCSGCC
ncbi:hypothetical protein M569_04201, partial [Genlisea aurea]